MFVRILFYQQAYPLLFWFAGRWEVWLSDNVSARTQPHDARAMGMMVPPSLQGINLGGLAGEAMEGEFFWPCSTFSFSAFSFLADTCMPHLTLLS